MAEERASPGDAPLIDRYLEMLSVERGAARNTILAYRNDLEAASAHIGGLGSADAEGLRGLSQHWAELPFLCRAQGRKLARLLRLSRSRGGTP